jgi:hypothetical protein
MGHHHQFIDRHEQGFRIIKELCEPFQFSTTTTANNNDNCNSVTILPGTEISLARPDTMQ